MWRFTSGWRTWFLAHVLWLGAAGLASASFVGVEAELVDSTEYGWTYRVYGTFNSAEDEVVAVYGWTPAPMVLNVVSPLFQSAAGEATAAGVNPAFYGAFPDLAYDSWFALGSEDVTGTSALNQAGMEASFEAFEAGGGFVLDDPVGGAWFIAPGSSADALAGAEGRVLLGQFTVTGLTEWTTNLQYFDSAGESMNAEGLTISLPQGVTLGCTDSEACNYNAEAVAEDGTCEYLSCAVYGCTDPIACNYISYATLDDGDCEYCSCQRPSAYTLTVETSPAVTPGLTVYRYYVNMLDPTDRMSAVYGNDQALLSVEAPSGVFNSPYNASWNASGINPAFLPVFPELVDDTYATMGLTGPASSSGLAGAADPSVVEDSGQPITPFFIDEDATSLLSNTLTGASWYILNTASNGVAGDDLRVLVMQVTSAGNVTGQLNYQVFPLAVGADALVVQVPFDGPGVFGGSEEVALCGCTDPEAANYNPESQYDDGSCVYDVPGCNDPVACNYDAAATLDDGTCDYQSCVVLGCLDPEADNYDPNATDDDGLCEYLGCVDPDALNPDPGATVDDGSCEYPAPSFSGVTVETVMTGYPTAGHATYRVYALLTNPLDQVSAIYGDSDTPMSMAVGTSLFQASAGAAFAPDLPLGDASDEVVADSWFTLGSDQPGGVMLNQAGLGEALMAFEQGDSWEVSSPAGGLWFVIPDMEEAAFPDTLGRVLLGQFTTDGYVSWTLNLQYLAQNGESYTHEQLTVAFPDASPGCMNAEACNYDPSAEVEDGSCDLESCVGCTDATACNYDSTFTQEDGSCTYPEDGYDCEGACLVDTDGDGVCDLFEVAGCTLENAENYNPEATEEDGSCVVLGCTSAEAENYNPEANEDDGTCVIWGCTDPDALNPNAEATDDDGSCEYPAPSFQGVTWEQVGANAAGVPIYRVYAAFENTLDQVIAVYGDSDEPLDISSTNGFVQETGSAAFAFDVLEPANAEEDSWLTLGVEPGEDASVTTIGVEAAAEAFEDGGSFMLSSASGGAWFVFPDNEPSAYPDESGRVLLAQLVTDGQVTFVVNLQHKAQSGEFNTASGLALTFPEGTTGCTDQEACNYDAAAQYEDGSCTYPPFALACDGSCIFDADGDGVCDEFEVEGCLDPSADNYVPNATDEVSCLYSGCTNANADNYDAQANVDDGSCVVAGCMYSFAANFDPLATYDDGSCYLDATGYCGDGTVWDEETQTCVQEVTAYINDDPDDLAILNPCYFDSDENGLVNLTDLLNLLTVYGLSCP